MTRLDDSTIRAPGPLLQAALCACLLAALPVQALTADHYELALRPDYAAQTLAGHARIRLSADAAAAPVVELSSTNLQISRVVDDGRDHVYTAFSTCQWLPCVGHDLDRATVSITLDLPPGQRSVASAGARPYPLYTLGFAAGRFTETVDPADARLHYLGASEDAAALLARFGDSARVLRFLEDKAGVPLPHAAYTQVLVPGGAAQEASNFSVIGNEMLDPILDDPQEDWVVAHELAHQWWGNLVTCATWSEFWLNEGITVFMTAAWKQHRWGDATYRRELALLDRRWQLARDAGFDRPLSWTGQYPSPGIRRSIQYSKGALFMHALREDIGERAFWAGLRRYIQDNAGRSVRSADLQAAMERSAGRSLKALFDRWAY